MKIRAKQLECKRCGHKWFPRKYEVMLCAKCHSPFWDREKADELDKKLGVKDEKQV